MSTESKHTTEWEVRHNGHYYEVGAANKLYAHINVFHATGEKNDKRQSRYEALKMAHLIKAAPALLEALENLMNSGLIDIGMKGPGSKAWSDSVQKAKEAIKQAKP